MTRQRNGQHSVSAGGGEYFIPDTTGGEIDVETRFRGSFVDENTIEGQFEWGPAFELSLTVASHPGTFRRRAQ